MSERQPAWLERLTSPQPIVRLEAIRIFAPLAILGFLSYRMANADHWIGKAGFAVPQLPAGDWRQPLYIAPVPDLLAWVLVGALCISGVLLSAGLFTRPAAFTFAATMAFVALADRTNAFTVNKLGTVVALGLALSPCGTRYAVDAWRARAEGKPPPRLTSWGNVRFFQGTFIGMYLGAGACKVRGDWMEQPDVLWTHLHDSYQTAVTHFLANTLPAASWTGLQAATLVLEVLAPLWFTWRRSIKPALLAAVGMHATIGLMFGPVVWFSLLMIVLVAASFSPATWLERALARLDAPAPTPARES
ncbi:MAG: HTTM domain-containing protein [Polyangiaceae bacterium]|nr:HTTM domain-containing protein [Polyangiaceae bacterium]